MIKIRLQIVILFLVLSATAGCSVKTDRYSITPWPTEYFPTALALTMAAEPALEYTSAPQATPTFFSDNLPSPTGIAEETANPAITTLTVSDDHKDLIITPTITGPEARIQIISPGSLSQVLSPINLESYAQPGSDKKVYIELIGEDGQILYHNSLTFKDLPRLWAPVNLRIPFTTLAANEFSRIQIFTIDQFQRVISLNSVNFFLQSGGLNRIFSNNTVTEYFILKSPAEKESITGGSLRIEGSFHPANQQPIFIELISNSGSIVGTKSIELQNENNEFYVPISTDMQYQVFNTTPVRLTIYQPDVRIPGYVYLFSQEIVLNP